MKILDIETIIHKLKTKTMARHTVVWYFCISFILIGQFSMLMALTSQQTINQALTDVIPSSIISLWGVWHCFSYNKAGDNINFLDRFFCLSVPILLRLMIGLFGVVILSAIGIIVISKGTITEIILPTPINVVAKSALEILYFRWLAHCIGRVSGHITKH